MWDGIKMNYSAQIIVMKDPTGLQTQAVSVRHTPMAPQYLAKLLFFQLCVYMCVCVSVMGNMPWCQCVPDLLRRHSGFKVMCIGMCMHTVKISEP